MKTTVTLSEKAAKGLELAFGEPFAVEEQPERMSWILQLMKALPDADAWFPKGKWATIQSVEGQLEEIASTWNKK